MKLISILTSNFSNDSESVIPMIKKRRYEEMNFQQQVNISLTVLFTGLVIVFVMLVILTVVIRGYGAAVNIIQQNSGSSKPELRDSHAPDAILKKNPSLAAIEAEPGIPAEIVAAISAAVYTMYGTSVGSVKSIRRSAQPNCSSWSMAGLLDNTRPF